MKNLLSVVLLFLAACGPTYTTITVTDFLNKRIEDFSLVIASYNNTPSITYPSGSFFGAFDHERYTKEEIEKHFIGALVENLKQRSTFAEVCCTTYKQAPKLSPAEYDMGNMFKLQIAIPDSGTILGFEACTADYVLLLEDVTLGTYQEYSGSPGMMMGGRGLNTPPMYMNSQPRYTEKYLQYKAEFVFWDNMEGKVITYGRVRTTVRADYLNRINPEHWEQVDNEFVEELLTGSPFIR